MMLFVCKCVDGSVLLGFDGECDGAIGALFVTLILDFLFDLFFGVRLLFSLKGVWFRSGMLVLNATAPSPLRCHFPNIENVKQRLESYIQ